MAQEPDDIGRYPQSTPAGEPIPFEIVRPLGIIKVEVSATPSNDIALPDVNSFLVLHTNAACYVVLDGDGAVPVTDTYTANVVFVDTDEVIVVDHNAAETIGVIAAGTDEGTLHVQVCEKYKDIRKTAQLERM